MALVLLTALVLLLVGARPAAAAQDPQEPAARRVFDRSRPGVHLVVVAFTGDVTVPRVRFDLVSLEIAARPVAIQRGITSNSAFFDLMMEIARQEPLRFFLPQEVTETLPVSVVGTGSGFTVSPDGHIVTNAHVVAPNEEELARSIASKGLVDFNTALAEDLAQSMTQAGFTLSETHVRQLTAALEQYVANYLRLGEITSSIGIDPPPGGGGGAEVQVGTPAQLTVAGESIPGDDIAVIKAENASNMPTVPLGDDTTLGTGDGLFVIGYPGAATFNPVLSEESQSEPTLTSGVLSAKRTLQSGTTVLQTDASISAGNSGGPVLDADGNVVGVATFGAVDPESGQPVDGVNFVMPVSLVRKFLNEAGVAPSESVTTQKYNAALDAIEQRHYLRALPLLQEVQRLYPEHPEVERLITESRTAIAEGRDESPRSGILGFLPTRGLSPALLGGLALAVMAVIAVVILVVTRSRRTPAPAAPVAHPATQGAYRTYPLAQSRHTVPHGEYVAQGGYQQGGYQVAQGTYQPDPNGAQRPAPVQYPEPDASYAPYQEAQYQPYQKVQYQQPQPQHQHQEMQDQEPAGQPRAQPPQPAPEVAAEAAPARSTGSCPFCGGPLRATAKFCPTCGNRVR